MNHNETYQPTPADFAERDRKRLENHEIHLAKLKEMARREGYEEIQNLEGLGLSQEEKEKLQTIRPEIFLKSTHPNGPVKIVARIVPTANDSGEIDADIFSPVFYEGHQHSNDFMMIEMEKKLTFARNGSPHKDFK